MLATLHPKIKGTVLFICMAVLPMGPNQESGPYYAWCYTTPEHLLTIWAKEIEQLLHNAWLHCTLGWNPLGKLKMMLFWFLCHRFSNENKTHAGTVFCYFEDYNFYNNWTTGISYAKFKLPCCLFIICWTSHCFLMQLFRPVTGECKMVSPTGMENLDLVVFVAYLGLL